MQKKSITFKVKGMRRDDDVSSASNEYAYEINNMRLMPTNTESLMALVTEKGIKSINNDLYNIFKNTIGYTILDNKIVLFTHDDSNVNNDCIYVFLIPFQQYTYASCLLVKNNLNFSKSNPIEAYPNYESEKNQKVYWTDGVNPLRYINICDKRFWGGEYYDYKGTKSCTTITDDISFLNFKFDILDAKLNIEKTNGGVFPSGVIQYVGVYQQEYGSESNVFYQSPLYYITQNNIGGSPEDKINIAFNVKYDGDLETFESKKYNIYAYSILRTSIDNVPLVRKFKLFKGIERLADKKVNKDTSLSLITPVVLDNTELVQFAKNNTENIAVNTTSKDNVNIDFVANIDTGEKKLNNNGDIYYYNNTSNKSQSVSVYDFSIFKYTDNNTNVYICEDYILSKKVQTTFKLYYYNSNTNYFNINQSIFDLRKGNLYIKDSFEKEEKTQTSNFNYTELSNASTLSGYKTYKASDFNLKSLDYYKIEKKFENNKFKFTYKQKYNILEKKETNNKRLYLDILIRNSYGINFTTGESIIFSYFEINDNNIYINLNSNENKYLNYIKIKRGYNAYADLNITDNNEFTTKFNSNILSSIYENTYLVPQDMLKIKDITIYYTSNGSTRNIDDVLGAQTESGSKYYIVKEESFSPAPNTTKLIHWGKLNFNFVGASSSSPIGIRIPINENNVTITQDKVDSENINIKNYTGNVKITYNLKNNELTPKKIQINNNFYQYEPNYKNIYNIIDYGNTGYSIDPTELLYKNNLNIIAKTIMSKDNTLFLGKLKNTIDLNVNNLNVTGTVTFTNGSNLDSIYNGNSYSNKYFKRNEIYIFGVQLKHKTGFYSEPIFIKTQVCDKDKAKAKITLSNYGTLKNNGWISIRPLLVDLDTCEKQILAQGFICPTVEYKKNDVNIMASWISRPDQTSSSSSSNYPSFAGRLGYDYYSTTENTTKTFNNSEIQGESVNNETFEVNRYYLTFHSPEIEKNNISNIQSLDNYKFRIVGYAEVKSVNNKLNIRTKTPKNDRIGSEETDTPYFIKYGSPKGLIFKENSKVPFISGFCWNDNYNLIMTHHSDYPGHKRFSFIADFKIYLWQRSGSLINCENPFGGYQKDTLPSLLEHKCISNLWNCTTTYFSTISESYTLDLDYAKLYKSDNIELYKINNDYYNANVDLVVTHDNSYDYFIKTTPIAYVNSPYTGNECITTIEKYKTTFNNIFTNNPKISNDNADTAYKTNSPVRIKYKSTPHVILHKSDEMGLGIPKTFNITGNKSLFYIGEFYTEQKLYDKNFAIQKTWLPCGNEVSLTGFNSNLTCDEGDTYYQKYECLKTYPYTLEDENSVIDIVSFDCATRINLDGRYDSNKSTYTNQSLMPSNFNKINEIYSQKNNFFTYRIKKEDYINNNEFKNSITWSKTKVNGEEVDSWTDITMASILDMDGDKGQINAIRKFNNNLLCFQDKAISQILFNENMQIASTSGVPIEIVNSGKVNGKRYLSNSIGCVNKWSICETPNGLYWIDDINKSLMMFNGQFNNISDQKGFRTWFKNNCQLNEWNINNNNNTCYLSYNNINNDLNIVYKDKVLTFNDALGEFTSFYGYKNLWPVFNHKDKYIGTGNDLTGYLNEDNNLLNNQINNTIDYDNCRLSFGDNLVKKPDSEQLNLSAENDNKFKHKEIVKNLSLNMTYTISIGSSSYTTTNSSGPTQFTINNYDYSNGKEKPYRMNFSNKKQSYTFIAEHPSLLIYSGLSGQTQNINSTFNNIKVELGSTATEWSLHPAEIKGQINKSSSIILKVATDGIIDKTFDNIDWRTTNDSYDNHTFDYIRAYNEYQDTGWYHLSGLWLKRKFRIWRALIARNKNTRDRIRNPWAKISLSYIPKNDDSQFTVHDITVNYFEQ